MTTTRVLAILLALAPALVIAADDTASHRSVYEQVNKARSSMKKARATARAPGVEYDSDLTAWSDGTGVRKVLAVDKDDSGNVEREYYYDGGALVFVYEAIQGWEGKKQVTRVEHRFYFSGGKLFRWLGGKEKSVVSPKDPEWAEREAALTGASKAYLAALGGKGGAKPVATQVSVGTFTGIEQGDYAHFNMKLADGTEESFFVLQDDGGLKEFLEKPDAFKGKKVEVRWQEREENIPEAGGPQVIKVAIGAKRVK